MKQTLISTLSFFTIATCMTACSGQIADKIAVVGDPSLSSDPCAVIDQKVMRLNQFTEVVKQTSAFHLEEKAQAMPVPGITVSNNRKQMLRDAEKKYAAYAKERQNLGCETPMPVAVDPTDDNVAMIDSCAAIDQKVMRLNRFAAVVKRTSAFHLEEKAQAVQVPGITVSNNRREILRDIEKKYAEYAKERQKQGCETPMPVASVQTDDTMNVADTPAVSSEPSADKDKKVMRRNVVTTKVNPGSSVHVEEKAVVSVAKTTTRHENEKILKEAKQKGTEGSEARQKKSALTPVRAERAHRVDNMAVADNTALSSETCASIEQELAELYEFMIMVNNTSAFHLEEKAQAMPIPGITVSNNKKKMLRDAKRKRVELLAEYEKEGCEAPGKE